MWLGPTYALYIGPGLDLAPHSGSVACLAVAVDGAFSVTVDGSTSALLVSALVPPRLVHQVVGDGRRMAFCFLEPGTQRHRRCQKSMAVRAGPVRFGHAHERTLASAAADLSDVEGWVDVAGSLGPAAWTPDPRLERALAVLRDREGQPGATELADSVGLSPSRFLHLFAEHTGTSLRRYRLWIKMRAAARSLAHGGDLTRAAAEAGFASPSHFSDAFHRMFGLRPSRLRGAVITTVNQP